MSMEEKAFRRLVKEHSAAIQAYDDAGMRVAVAMGKLSAEICNQGVTRDFEYQLYNKCCKAGELMDKALAAARDVLRPD